jgi:AcrR family transcriptional regulator
MGESLPFDPGTEDAVHAAARSVFAEHGMLGVDPQAVAERAGVDVERLYQRWPRPELLLAEALGRDLAIEDVPDLGNSRLELRIAVDRMIGNYTQRPAFEQTLLRLAVAGGVGYDQLPRVRELAEEHWRGTVVAVLRRAIARGAIAPDADLDLIVDFWAGAIGYRRTFRSHEMLGAPFREVLLLVLSGMVPLRTPAPRLADAPPESLIETQRWLRRVRLGRIVRIADGVPVGALADAPEHRTTIDGHPVKVTANVWRNFKPMITEDSTRMIVIVSVTADGAGTLPPFLSADRVIVLNGQEAWVAPLEQDNPLARSSREFEVAARLGPKWETGSSVDLVVRLSVDGGAVRLVRLPGQLIGRTS